MNSTHVVGIGALILTGIFYFQLEGLPSVAQRLPGLLIWIVAILAILMLAEEAVKKRRLRKVTQTVEDDAPLPPINWKVAISFSVALVVYVALIPVVGYIITTIIFMAGVLLFSQTIRARSAVLISVGLTAFVWVVFIWALGLPVPLLPWLN
ncbi:tripartite tricarboxylate transporter TctB family protein [Alcaligenaceae bacterium]|nr:tripartite tricarboxylate transporter TctB family protein [Alcaligenaceae bacterium]